MTDLLPTPEQEAILACAKLPDDLLIVALAGTGKTSTICMLAKELPAKPTLALAFNTKIKEELSARLPSSVQCLTLNGLGHKAWSNQLGKHSSVDGKKPYRLVDWLQQKQNLRFSFDERGDLVSLINAAKSLGWVPAGTALKAFPTLRDEAVEEVFDWADIDHSKELEVALRACMLENIRLGLAGDIDFNDQIYLPVIFRAPVPKYDTVIVDEAQDLSRLNHRLILAACGRRLIAVGDPNQAIYAFRGASSSSLDDLREQRTFIELPLTQTFRCGKAIVARQQTFVPAFRAADTNPEGEVVYFEDWTKEDIPPSSAVICRNNAPLLSFAFKLIKQGVGCKMLGRDIGTALKRRLEKATKGLSPLAGKDLMQDSIKEWHSKELRLAKSDRKIASLDDTFDCLIAIASEAENLSAALAFCAALFADKAAIVTLSSGHKCKGLEWDSVIHLDPFRLPSKFAKTPEDFRQENNLRYVIETRAKKTLILANLDDFS